MPRSGEDARRRLRDAALSLFLERGYDDTTAAAIAERAGVTERTFFRHFPDKREVLFGSEAELLEEFRLRVAEAPADVDVLDVLRCAFAGSIPLLADKRSFAQPRHELIEATPALQERQLIKLATMHRELVAALVERGVTERRAGLATQIGLAAFGDAMLAWNAEPDADMDVLLDRAFDDVRALAG